MAIFDITYDANQTFVEQRPAGTPGGTLLDIVFVYDSSFDMITPLANTEVSTTFVS